MIEQIKELRAETGVSYVKCKKALIESNGDVKDAIDILRKAGIKLGSGHERQTIYGVVGSYSHTGDQIAALVELKCETETVSSMQDFVDVAKVLAMQVVALDPKWINVSDIPEDVLEREKDVLRAEAENSGKPEHVIKKIVDGRMVHFYKQNCLMQQPYIKDEQISVEEMLADLIAAWNEKVVIEKYVRFQVGD